MVDVAPITGLTGGDCLCRLDRLVDAPRHEAKRYELCRRPLAFRMAPAHKQAFVDAGFFREVDPFRIMAGDNAFDMESFGEKAAFVNAGCASASRGGNDHCQNAFVGFQKLVGERREERSDAIGCNHPPRCWIARLEPVTHVKFMALHGLDRFRAKFPASFPVVREWSVHDYYVEIVQREPDFFAFIDLGSVEGFQRPAWRRHCMQIQRVTGCRQNFQRSRFGRTVALREDGSHLANIFTAIHARAPIPRGLSTATWGTLGSWWAGFDTPTYRAVFANDMAADLDKIRAPTRILTDTGDSLHEQDRGVAGRRADFSLEVFSDGGSFSLMLDPNRWAERVREFVANASS